MNNPGPAEKKAILVTGASGMIGSRLVAALTASGYSVAGIDRAEASFTADGYRHFKVDLSDSRAIRTVIEEQGICRVIHLAALAHTKDESDLSWERYRHINVECAANVFKAAGDLPVLFISTVDVYGFTNGIITPSTPLRPVTFYGRSKVMAEEECRKLPHYTIFRFSPVYTETVKRDIQKRYYLKYPNIAYRIGKGSEYEILNVERAVEAMVGWCASVPANDIHIIKDPENMKTVEYIKAEKQQGRAKRVLYFPAWVVKTGYNLLKLLTGENKYTYLLDKAVHPVRSENF